MHGIIWFYELPCMESYDSMRGIAWKVCRSWFHAWNRMESYGSYASMHGIAWKPYEFGSGLFLDIQNARVVGNNLRYFFCVWVEQF